MLSVGIHGGAELKSGFLILVSDSGPAWNLNSVVDDLTNTSDEVVLIGRGG